MPAQEVSQQTFEQDVLQSDTPVLLELHAGSQPASAQMVPTFHDIADEYGDALKVYTCDLEKNPGIAQAFRVQQIPLTALIIDGQPVEMTPGVLQRNQLDQLLNQYVEASTDGVQTWDISRAADALTNKKARPVDLRSNNDYGRARLPGAVNAPIEDLENLLTSLTKPKKTLLVYTRTSKDIREYAETIAQAGSQVAILDGGMLAWEAEGKDVEKGSPTTELL